MFKVQKQRSVGRFIVIMCSFDKVEYCIYEGLPAEKLLIYNMVWLRLICGDRFNDYALCSSSCAESARYLLFMSGARKLNVDVLACDVNRLTFSLFSGYLCCKGFV